MPYPVLCTLCALSYLLPAPVLWNKLRVNLSNVIELVNGGGKIWAAVYLTWKLQLLGTVVMFLAASVCCLPSPQIGQGMVGAV